MCSTTHPREYTKTTKLQLAQDELVQLLWSQDVAATEIIDHFSGIAIGISVRTVNEAKKMLGVVSIRKENKCYWHLPDEVRAQYSHEQEADTTSP